ncbi:MAG: hypothetical protein IT373_20825 [Polyangiaceae bacterium]|nr:hypothetical protein [Polyangiaceae bacterium]
MSARIDVHELLVPLLGRRDRRAVFTGRWRREPGDPAELLSAHLRGELVLGALHGGEPTTRLMAWDVDGAEHASQGADADSRAATDALCRAIDRLDLMPALICTSKSGAGRHPYALLAEPVDTGVAARLARAIGRSVGRDELDVPYPSGPSGDGLVLALPWCGLLGRARYVSGDGSRIVHGSTHRPYCGSDAYPGHELTDADAQAEVLRDWPRSTADHVRRAAAALGVLDAPAEAPVGPPVVDRSRRPLPVFADKLDILARECAFVEEAARCPAGLTYKDWFALATILRPFPGGAAFFDAVSQGDRGRYRPGEPARKLASVHGAPRHCRSLDFTCSRLDHCEALGVRSPAGLPFKLRRAKRIGGAT